ncbi:MAG: class I SAM-dependent methyltransferase [Paracoccaceae bacterium]|nr:class I SAM-dependent methyltransferase [Paracoccaceae bacterium]
MTADAIKSMKLYSQVDRVFRDLRAAGIADDAPLSVDQLSQFDQYHYFGTEAVEAAIRHAGISPASHVLEIGAGIGGPARVIADRSGCSVTALELQPDLNEVATSLTARCGLSERVDHACGDALTYALPDETHDALVSWLALFHIPKRDRLFARCHATLKPGGVFYAEDLYKLGDFTPEQHEQLTQMVFGQSMSTEDEYVAALKAAGFADVRFDNRTASWTDFCVTRLAAYRAARARHLSIHGPAVVDGLTEFYQTMVDLFESGNLGGTVVTARKSG